MMMMMNYTGRPEKKKKQTDIFSLLLISLVGLGKGDDVNWK